MKSERQKSKLEVAVEMLAAKGINTIGGVFSLVTMEEFDPESGKFIEVLKIKKEKGDSIVYFPYTEGGDSNVTS